MDENLSRGYVQLGKARRMNEFKFSDHHTATASGGSSAAAGGGVGGSAGFARAAPPVDRWNLVYLSLLLAGAGFLLPYNSFIIAVDYFQDRYPGTTVVFDMSVVYIITAFFAVLLNNVLVETLSLGTRIIFGYFVSFVTLNFVATCEILWDLFSLSTSYTINLIAVAVVSLGCTGLAGFWVSLNRLISKSLIDDERGNTSAFFYMSILTIVLSYVMQKIIHKTEFVQYHVAQCQERNRIVLEPQDYQDDLAASGLMDPMDGGSGGGGGGDSASRGQYGVLKLHTSPPPNNETTGAGDGGSDSTGQFFEFSFSNPVYDPTAPTSQPPPGMSSGGSSGGTTYKVEDIVVMRGGNYGNERIRAPPSRMSKRWSGIKRGMLARLEVSKLIYPYMASIGMAYFVTLCLYPGIISEIASCRFGSWMPVILMACFNGADLVGKILATLPIQWTRPQLLNFSFSRLFLIPLFLMCAIPRYAPILRSELSPIVLSIVLGLSNGIFGSVPMIQAPAKVPEELRELAGNIMTLSYTTGLCLGSIMAYMFEACLGPPVTFWRLCAPPPPSAVNVATTTTTTTNSTHILTSHLFTFHPYSFVTSSSTPRPTTTTTTASTTTARATTTMATLLSSSLASLERMTKKQRTKLPKLRTTTTAMTTTLTSLFTTAYMTTMEGNPEVGLIGNATRLVANATAQAFANAD
ncbi:unnamed protein product [Trichogramma brassicae]|uniref:Equilibrative nucleoside transporter 4 n=1 Tax=Trichogramma brassicae TaxID=86971 RepID=A0A6H5HVZ4_9HYME|nr:unnamed protein product [Trichogramma brassicae]